jgi:hypothetical protein
MEFQVRISELKKEAYNVMIKSIINEENESHNLICIK